jgi:hypothetical protein
MGNEMIREPKLAPPGAGLPKLELLIANLTFRWGRSRCSRGKVILDFARRKEEILALVRQTDEKICAQRVLIPRLKGLEDSSRYWSVFMTLDHLRMVNEVITAVISSLVAGEVPSRVASTANVKPNPNVDQEIVTAFEESCERLEQCVAENPNLTTEKKYTHPWFGPLDAASWHFMASFHMNLHRKQIHSIVSRAK